MRLPAAPSKRATIITPAQVKLLASLIDERSARLVLFAAYTGMRPGELAALRWRHLDLAGLAVTVSEAAVELSLSALAESNPFLLSPEPDNKPAPNPFKTASGRSGSPMNGKKKSADPYSRSMLEKRFPALRWR